MLTALKLSSDPVVADLTKSQGFSPFLPIILQMPWWGHHHELEFVGSLLHSVGETEEAQAGWRKQRRLRWGRRDRRVRGLEDTGDAGGVKEIMEAQVG